MGFDRLRRLRKNEAVRDLAAQTQLDIGDLIMPYFVIEGRDEKEAIKSMPGIYRLSVDNLVKEVREARDLGIRAVLIFGVAKKKDALGIQAYKKEGLVQKAIKAIRKNIKDIVIITDVCLCGYTSHGHCGIFKRSPQSTVHSQQKNRGPWTTDYGLIDNDATLKILSKIALSHAQAGADFVAPSAMMDGQVKAIREALDQNGLFETGILAYAAKYSSSFYGPFREALDSAPQFGDRKTYQMDYRNSDEALREIGQDIEEGADIVMVKPALAYLDIIYRAKQNFNIPLAAYNVSAEYSLIKTASRQGVVNERDIILEVLNSIKRAGADLIITYHAKEAAEWLKD